MQYSDILERYFEKVDRGSGRMVGYSLEELPTDRRDAAMRLKRPRPRTRLNAALLCLLLACTLGQAAPALGEQQWIALDPELHRQGDRSSIERQGPWVQFTQSWGELKSGKPGENAIVKRMAVNCLTGAYGQTQYPSTDPKTNKPILDEYPRLRAYMERMYARPHAPPRIAEAFASLRARAN
jgi:glutathione S-transferase